MKLPDILLEVFSLFYICVFIAWAFGYGGEGLVTLYLLVRIPTLVYLSAWDDIRVLWGSVPGKWGLCIYGAAQCVYVIVLMYPIGWFSVWIVMTCFTVTHGDKDLQRVGLVYRYVPDITAR